MKSLLLAGLFVLAGARIAHAQFSADAVQQIPQDQYSDPYLYQNPAPPPHPVPPPHPHPVPPPHPPYPPPHPHPIPPPPHHPYPPYPPPYPPPYYNDQYIDCESIHHRYTECFFDPYGVRDIQLVQVHSLAACIGGQTYGYYSDRIWVDDGCRATFFIDRW